MTKIIDHGDGSVTLDFAEGFKLERGEQTAFLKAYREKNRGRRPLGGPGLVFMFYFRDRQAGMSREDAMKKHLS